LRQIVSISTGSLPGDRIPNVRAFFGIGPNRLVCRTFEQDGDTGGIVSELLLLKVERILHREAFWFTF